MKRNNCPLPFLRRYGSFCVAHWAGREAASLTQWSYLCIGIYSSHEERIFITISLLVRCFITDVNLGDAVEVLDVFLNPTVHQLISSADLVVLPPVQCGGEFAAVFRCSSSCMICLPWIMSTFLPSWRDFCGAAKAIMIRSIVLWLGLSHTPHWHTFNPSGTCFR